MLHRPNKRHFPDGGAGETEIVVGRKFTKQPLLLVFSVTSKESTMLLPSINSVSQVCHIAGILEMMMVVIDAYDHIYAIRISLIAELAELVLSWYFIGVNPDLQNL